MGQKLYNTLQVQRDIFLERARTASKLTLPMVIREKGHTSSAEFEVPWQSVGSRGVSALSSELLMSLFPVNTPFFRLLVSDSDFEQFEEQAETIKNEVMEELATIERTVLEEIEGKNLRSVIIEALKNLLIAGNSLVYVQPDGELRNYTLEDYVVDRDISGNVLTIVIKEQLARSIAETLDLVDELPSSQDAAEGQDSVTLYTCIQRRDEKYYVYQDVDGVRVDEEEEEYELDKLPWLPLRLSKVTGEDYGRGYVENTIGDLKSLEFLRKNLIEAAGVSSKTIFFVSAGSTVRAKDVAEAANGDVLDGDAADVTVLTTGKGGDLSIALQAANKLETGLAFAYNLLDNTLPTSGATTAFEVAQIVDRLERVLSGTYAMLASEFMQPLVGLIIDRLSEQGAIGDIPPQVKLIISSGLTALGRTSDIERLRRFSQEAIAMSPEAYNGLLDHEKMLRQLQAAVGVDVLKTKEQVEQERAEIQKQQQELAEQQQAQQIAESLQNNEQEE